MRRFLVSLVLSVMVLQTASCGLVLYPERQGQKSGKIDPGVAILDAAGLIVFIIPGLIAFGVDFLTGCIYLPGGSKASADSTTVPLREIHVDPQQLTADRIEQAVASYAGQRVDLRGKAVTALVVPDEAALRIEISRAL